MMTNAQLNSLLFYAFRYALGRRTYVVQEVADMLIENKGALTRRIKYQIVEEIKREVEVKSLMKMDEEVWLKVVRELGGMESSSYE